MGFVIWMVLSVIASMVFQRKIEETFPLVVFAGISILFVCGLVGPLSVGLWLIVGLACCGFVYAIYRKRWDHRLVLTPGALFLVLLFVFASYLHQYRVVFDWDEIAQWALAPKNTYVLDRIPTPDISNMVYTSYPPATSLYQYLWCKFAGGFQDSHLYIAMMVLNIGILAPVWKDFTWKKWGRILPCAFLLLVAPRAFLTMSWDSLLVDYLLGAVMVSLLYQYYNGEGKVFDWLYAALGLFVVVQVKETGLFFAALYLVAVLLDQCFCSVKGGTKEWMSSIRSKKAQILAGVTVLALPFAGKLLWSWFLHKNGIAEFWGGGEGISLSVLNVFDRNNGVQPWQRTGFKNFWLSVFNHKFSSRTVFYLHNFEVPLIVWVMILAVLTLVIYGLYRREKRVGCMMLVLWIGNMIFTVALAYMYYLKLSEAENAVLSAYSRYIGTMNSAIWLMGVLLFLRHLSTCRWSVGIVSTLLILALLPRYEASTFVVSEQERRAAVSAYEDRQREYEKALAVAEYIQDGTTIIYNGKTHTYNYLLAPIRFVGPFGNTVITDFNYFLGQVPYKKYVYFDDKAGDLITEEFIKNYGHRFHSDDGNAYDEIVNHGLYRALYHPDGTAVLQYITTVNVEDR